MIFYFTLLIFIIISSLFVTYGKDKYFVFINKFITFNLLFIPAALRYRVGCDYDEYTIIFNEYISHGFYRGFEAGFSALNRIIYLCGLDVQWLFVITAFLTLFFIFFKLEKKDWIVYAPITMMIVNTWMYTEIRQILAMVMLFSVVRYWEKEKKKTSIIIFILSFFFHKSVVLYLPILLIIFLFSKFQRKKILILFFIYMISCVLLNNVLSKILLNIIGLTPYGKAYLYLAQAGGNDAKWLGATAVNSGLGRIVRYFIYSIIMIFYPKDARKKNYLLFFVFCCINFSSAMIQIVNRIQRTILFTYFYSGKDYYYSKKNRVFCRLLIFICCLLLFFMDLYGGYNGGLHYKTIFSR